MEKMFINQQFGTFFYMMLPKILSKHMRIGENVVYQHFLTMFPKGYFFQGNLKLGLCGKGLKTFSED